MVFLKIINDFLIVADKGKVQFIAMSIKVQVFFTSIVLTILFGGL